MLSTQRLGAERSKEILIEAGLLASENAVQAELLETTLLKAGIKKTERDEILRKLNLITVQNGEAVAQGVCTAADLKAVLAQKLKNAEDAEGILVALGLAGANTGATLSFELLTKAIWKNIVAMAKWLVTNPFGVAALAVGGVALAVDLFTTSVEENNEAIEKATDNIEEYQNAIDEINSKEQDVNDTYKEYASLMSKSNAYGINASEKERLLSLSNKLVNTYGLEVQGIDSVTGAYVIGTGAVNEYTEALRAERLEKQKSQTEERETRIDSNISNASKYQKDLDILKKAKTNYAKFKDIISEYKNSINQEDLSIQEKSAILQQTSTNIQNKAAELGLGTDVATKIYQNATELISIDQEIDKLTGKVSSAVNSVVQDILTNIQVENADILDSNSESFMTSLLMPYLSSDSIDWDTFDREDFQEKVTEFINANKDDIDDIIKDITTTSNAISSDDVSISDYKKYIENETTRAEMIASITGDEKSGQSIIDNLSNNFGAAMAKISNDLGKSSGMFDTFATNFLRLEREFVEGGITFDEYIDSINSSLGDLDIEETFGNNKDEMKSFFFTMQDKGTKVLENIAADFKAGKKSLKDYIGEVDTVGSYFVKLGEKAASVGSALGMDSDVVKSIQDTSTKLSTLLTELKSMQDVVEGVSVSFEDFKKKPLNSVEDLVNKLLKLGITIEDLGGKAGDSANDVANSLKTKSEAFAKMQTALALKTQSVLAQIGGSIGKIISGITDYVKKFKVSFQFKKSDDGKWGFEPVVSGESSVSWQDTRDYGDSVAGIERDANGNVTNWTSEKQKIFNEAIKANAEEVYWGNLLSDSIDMNFLNSLIGKDFTNTDGNGNTTDNKKTFDDNYYSTISAWLKESEKEIEKLERERQALNRQFENALDAGNKEQAEILKAKLVENSKKQKDILHGQNEILRATKSTLLKSLYELMPELDGKDWEEISEVTLAEIENRLSKEVEMAGDSDSKKNSATLTLNTFKGLIDDIRSVDDTIKENSTSWWEHDEDIRGYYQSQIDLREDYSNEWIDKEKAFDRLTEEEELAAYERKINNNKEFQKQILAEEGLSAEAKLALIKEVNDLILDNEKKAYDLRKSIFSKATDFGNTYLESQKTLLQSYCDVTNSIAEAQHEINKELETSKTMYEYLDEDTRKLLFNQDDYNELSEELLDIQYKADKLQRQYKRDLENSTLETIESITSNYQMQYETLMKSYEIAKADLEIAKKKQKLNNVLNERNVRMFINGSWQWVANTEDVANAKSELADAEYAKRVAEAGLTQQKSINNLTKQQDELGVIIKRFEGGVIDLDEAIELAEKAIIGLPQVISSMLKSAMGTTSYSYSGSSGGSSGGINYSLSQIASMSPSERSAAWHGASEESKYYLHKANEEDLSDSYTYDKASGTWREKYATGTRYTKSGLALMGEKDEEIYITANGRLVPINQPTIGNIGSGGVVFNREQMASVRNLWDLSNLGKVSPFVSSSNMNRQDTVIDNSIHINGLTVSEQGNEDWINGLRRYVATHK